MWLKLKDNIYKGVV